MKQELTMINTSDVNDMFEGGHIFLNHQQIQPKKILKRGDVLCSRVYRKDPDVLAGLPSVIFENKEFVAFYKPPSLPVHPNAMCVANTVLELLKLFSPYSELYTVHRLDALTQGLLIFAKSSHSASVMSEAIRSYDTRKIYYARVLGHFTRIPQTIRCSLTTISKCGSPLEKEAETYFECLKHTYIGTCPVSIMRCIPRTGRFHQIRKQLALIQHPIINDPVYNPTWKDFQAVSIVRKCVSKPVLWPIYKPSPQIEEEDKLMAIDLLASAYQFPTLNLDIALPHCLWPEWARQ
ncbi:RNA pseudouridylate synthase domain containing protein 2 [Coelomomyces lativittatus]|nr:RNA pseudouridylate synthase domain containing protein 2 [Coelomomyces lativittatus]